MFNSPILAINRYIISLVFILFLFVSCEKEDPIIDDPDIPEIINSTSSNIGTQGGIIELEGFRLYVPANAFDENNNITVNILESYESGFENQMSEIFQIEGLPEKTNNALTIRIPYTGTLDESTFLALGQETWNKSLDSLSMSYNLVEALDSAEYIIATLPEIDDNSKFAGEDIHTRSGEKWSVNILAISGYINVHSEEGHFKVVTQSANIDAALDLTSYFETAYTKFKDLGFSYSKRTKWPVTVSIKNLQGEFGAQMNSFFGINYGYIEIDKSILSNKDIMQVTAGHEFFHIVQSFYDPRGTFSMASRQSPNIWIEEASSTWSEELFSSNTNYLPLNFIQNYNYAIEGALNSSGDKAPSYGYGMSAFIKFIVDRYGTDKLVNVFEEMLAGKSAFKALDHVVPTSVSSLWGSFAQDLFSFKIYKGEDFKPVAVFSSLASESQHKIIIKNEADTTVLYDESLRNLSCEAYTFQFNYKDFASNAFIEFVQQCDNYDRLMFFKYKTTTTCEFIGSGEDTLLVSDFIGLIEDGYKLAAISSHGKLDEPYTAKTEVEAAFRIKEQFDFDYIKFYTNLEGDFIKEEKNHPIYGDTTIVKPVLLSFTTIWDIDNYTFNNVITGNEIVSTLTVPVDGGQRSYLVKSQFDRIQSPTKLVHFEFEIDYYHSADGSTWTQQIRIVLEDLPFRQDFLPELYSVNLEEFSQNLIEASYYQKVVQADWSSTSNLINAKTASYPLKISYRKHDE